ncbi:MAG: hypothetical protein PVF54_05410 [Anaerolineae bacterium]|jgi:hypothetical protein
MVPSLGESALPEKTLAWLLEPGDPSVRYLTLTRILRHSEDDPEVIASRKAIAGTSPARDILFAQYPQGYWMHPGIGYSPRFRATAWQILFLAQLGVGSGSAVDRAVGHLFEANQRDDGAFRASREPGHTPFCLNGSLLWALGRLGYSDVPQAMRAWTWLAGEIDEHGFSGESTNTEACPWGAVKVLWAANSFAAGRPSSVVERTRRAAVDWLLEQPPSTTRHDPRWFRLTFPLAHTADLLQWLTVLVDAGRGDDPRLAAAWSWLADKKMSGDVWPLERSPGKLWADFGQTGEPNKWVTVRALRVGR